MLNLQEVAVDPVVVVAADNNYKSDAGLYALQYWLQLNSNDWHRKIF